MCSSNIFLIRQILITPVCYTLKGLIMEIFQSKENLFAIRYFDKNYD